MTLALLKRVPARALSAAACLSLSLVLAGCDLDLMKSAADYRADEVKALEARNFSVAAATAQKLVDKAPQEYESYFLLAQAKAQAGDKSGAIVALEQAIKNGLRDDALIDGHPNLEPIKSMSAYADLMKSSFPSRWTGIELSASGISAGGEAGVSIRESNGKQVLRAGDVVIELPAGK